MPLHCLTFVSNLRTLDCFPRLLHSIISKPSPPPHILDAAAQAISVWSGRYRRQPEKPARRVTALRSFRQGVLFNVHGSQDARAVPFGNRKTKTIYREHKTAVLKGSVLLRNRGSGVDFDNHNNTSHNKILLHKSPARAPMTNFYKSSPWQTFPTWRFPLFTCRHWPTIASLMPIGLSVFFQILCISLSQLIGWHFAPVWTVLSDLARQCGCLMWWPKQLVRQLDRTIDG